MEINNIDLVLANRNGQPKIEYTLDQVLKNLKFLVLEKMRLEVWWLWIWMVINILISL